MTYLDVVEASPEKKKKNEAFQSLHTLITSAALHVPLSKLSGSFKNKFKNYIKHCPRPLFIYLHSL